MNLDNLYLFLLVLRLFLPFVGLFAVIYACYPEQTKALYHIRRTFAPLYDKIEEQYGPESYPTIMSNPACGFFKLTKLNHWKCVFFVRDSSFVIMNIKDGTILGTIPFTSVVYAFAELTAVSHHAYYYYVSICFNTDDGKEKSLIFKTIRYNHRLNKKYDDRFNGTQLSNFIDVNFIDILEYQENRRNR